jgi:hypothetical protein
MHLSGYLFISLVCCMALICAGCIQSPASPVSVTSATGPVPVGDPEQLALTQSDMPLGFTLVESRAKTSADLSKIAMELGWQGGYVARFTGPAAGGMGGSEIVQSIAIYPEKTIPDVITLAEQQGRSDSSLVYSDLTVRGLGENARAFSGKAGMQVTIKPTPANPVVAGMKSGEVQAVSTNDVAMIIFSKGNTFEAFRMTGPSADTALLLELALKAYAKIP